MVRREGLEPTRLAAPAPKAGASTNSATLAARTKKARIKQRIIPFGPMPVGHYENFPVASLLLPRRLRPPVEIIYRFARSADDIADEGAAADDVRLSRLSVYRSELGRIAGGQLPDAPLFHDVARIVREYGLPLGLFGDLVDALARAHPARPAARALARWAHRPRDPRHDPGRPADSREDRARRLRCLSAPPGARRLRLAARAAASSMTPDEYCRQKAAASGSSFYYSFLFLPGERRRAITALYAFCREVDDVVDEAMEP